MRNPQPTGSRGRVLVLQHHPDEHPGSLGPLLEDAGLALTTVELDAGEAIPALEPFDLMLVMGGPQHVWEEDEHPWLVTEKAAIRRWVGELGRPYLGVCLGHQLLADAMGGTVALMETPEIGVIEVERTPAGAVDPLFGRLPAQCPACSGTRPRWSSRRPAPSCWPRTRFSPCRRCASARAPSACSSTSRWAPTPFRSGPPCPSTSARSPRTSAAPTPCSAP